MNSNFDFLWRLREKLRNNKIVPNWSRFGIPLLMTKPEMYAIVTILLPSLALVLLFAVLGGWIMGVLLLPIIILVVWFLQFLVLQ